MAEARFYQFVGPRSITDIAALVGGELVLPSGSGPGGSLSDVAALGQAGPGDLTYFDNLKRCGELVTGRPGACLVDHNCQGEVIDAGLVAIVVDRPQVAFVRAARALLVARETWDVDHGEHNPPLIDPTARLGPNVVVGGGAQIGADVRIDPGCVIGPGVTIAAGCRVGANTLISFADIAANSVIHSGVQIGGAGFGLAFDEHGPLDSPHFGAVKVGQRVTIGCNTTVDRGRFTDTVIGDDTKIDNLVQVAHNVQIGRGCVIAGCCGLAGSSVLGDGVILGGAGGVADHVEIGAGARLAAGSAAMKAVPAGETWAGAPARPVQSFFREIAALRRIARRAERKG